MKVAVSILSADFANAWEELKVIDNDVDYYHMDVMDGAFVPNISFGAHVIKCFRGKTIKKFDTHLMIKNPKKYIKDFVMAGSDMISFHLESDDDPLEVIEEIHSYNKLAGIAIKPNTKVEELIPYLKKADYFLVMSVEPGFGGQKFMEGSLEKIEKLAKWRSLDNLNYLISVDGGINDQTSRLVVEKGIDFAVVGSYLLDKKDPHKKIEILKNI